MIVTTGGRDSKSRPDSFPWSTSKTLSALNATFSIWWSNSEATRVAVSTSNIWLIVAIIPRSINFLMTSPALTPISRARSPTLTTSDILTTRLLALGTVISVLRCSTPGNARFFFGMRPERSSRSWTATAPCFLITRFLCLTVLGAFSSTSGASFPSSARSRRGASSRTALSGTNSWAANGTRGAGAGSTLSPWRRSILPRTLAPRGASSTTCGAAASATGAGDGSATGALVGNSGSGRLSTDCGAARAGSSTGGTSTGSTTGDGSALGTSLAAAGSGPVSSTAGALATSTFAGGT